MQAPLESGKTQDDDDPDRNTPVRVIRRNLDKRKYKALFCPFKCQYGWPIEWDAVAGEFRGV